ncbi:MAG: hypothetical protein QG646_2552 [Euryarchaeota archaeon]|nr:hypothetical protein [Euryarchaeota archaeon]
MCIGEVTAFSSKGYMETDENLNQGIITLFSQNYSGNSITPNDVFIAKVQGNHIFDSLYSIVYGTLRPEVLFNSASEGLEYKTTRDSCLFPRSLFPSTDTVLDFGINKFPGSLMKSPETDGFCKVASIPLIQYREQPRQSGSLYICNLTPMTRCTYQVSMDMNTDDNHSCVEIKSPGSRLVIQGINNSVVLRSYFENSSKDIRSKSICIGNTTGKLDFEIIFDGYNKTNTICIKDGRNIETPFYSFERQRLPYVDFSNGYIKFTAFIMGKGTYMDVDIYRIDQKADRKLITPIGNNKMMPFGLDGPHARNTIEKGISYLESKNQKGTIWFDKEYLEKYNEMDLEYLRNLVANDSWEVGIHYSKELNSLPPEQAFKVMDEEYSYVYEKIGRKPTTWCSMRNRDNLTHAIYAYQKLGMLWRNGDSGINAEMSVGNLDDDTWEWWRQVSEAGMVYPVFTHELDQEPAIKYSISCSKFNKWVDNYCSNNISIVPFYEYSQVSRNTYDAYFDALKYNESLLIFDAHTNGARSLINVNVTARNHTQVYDCTLNESLNYTIEADKSITFWVENNHTYNVYPGGMHKT